MNIKISIKDCECNPTVNNHQQLSEVQHKKRTMLYAPPQRDKKQTITIDKKNQNNSKNPSTKKTTPINSQKYRQSQKQMLDELKKNGQNRATVDMVQNSNNILQKQNQILAQNQKTINQMAERNGNGRRSLEQEKVVSQMTTALHKLQEEMIQMRKIRDQIKKSAQQFNQNINQPKNQRNMHQNLPQLPHMNQMNSNLKDLVQVSKNQVEGLENLEALKNLQNFNIETYNQAINSIKRQIAQYQKQSDNIERQLKIRAAKLYKLQISPKFDEELYKPYQQHLHAKVNSIDLYSIRQKVYDRLGSFDYGKFEYQIGEIMCQAKKQLGNFSLICKEYEIRPPEIKLDMKELKNIDTKTPSVLDQYKIKRGIVFQSRKENSEKLSNNTGNLIKDSRLKRTNALQQKLKTLQTKKPQTLRNIQSKPIDTSNNIKLTKESQKGKTILENQHQRQKKALQARMKKPKEAHKKEQEQAFDKYLQNRAKEQLELIYKQRNERLKKMQQQLQQTCQEPLTFIQLNLDKHRKQQQHSSPIHKNKKQQIQQEYDDQFQQEQDQKNDNNGNKFMKNQSEQIRQQTRDILKDKLKNLLKDKKGSSSRQKIYDTSADNRNFIKKGQPSQNCEDPNRQITNMAEGFVNMINNSLTQINANLATAIQRRVANNGSTSQEKRKGSLQRKQARRIQIPKLQEIRPPPAFNVNLIQPSQPIISYPYSQTQNLPHPSSYPQQPPRYTQEKPKKIIIQEFDNLKPQQDDSYSDLNISEMDDDDI